MYKLFEIFWTIQTLLFQISRSLIHNSIKNEGYDNQGLTDNCQRVEAIKSCLVIDYNSYHTNIVNR